MLLSTSTTTPHFTLIKIFIHLLHHNCSWQHRHHTNDHTVSVHCINNRGSTRLDRLTSHSLRSYSLLASTCHMSVDKSDMMCFERRIARFEAQFERRAALVRSELCRVMRAALNIHKESKGARAACREPQLQQIMQVDASSSASPHENIA